MNLPDEKVLTQYVRFAGGLDLETPVLSLDPGLALDAMNYQPGLFGGYERIDAFERYDGRTAPSAATYYTATVSDSGSIFAGCSIRGATSGATATVVRIATPFLIVLTKVVGTFAASESITQALGGLPLLLTMNYPVSTVATISAVTLSGHSDAYNDAYSTNAAADVYRADIGPVPGSGPVRGVWVYRGVVYAFRDDSLGAFCQMWKATSTGWVQILMGEEIAFTNGTDLVLDGDTLTQGTATAQIARVVQTTSATSPARVGRLILTGRSNNFYLGPATTSSGGTLTISDLTP